MTDATPFTIDNLPRILIAAMRAGTWQTPKAQELRLLARAVAQAQHVELDVRDLMVVLAMHASGDMPVPNADWTPEMRAIHDLIWPFLASSVALSCTFERDNGGCRTIEDSTVAVRNWTQQQIVAIETTPAQADAILRDALARVSAQHPQLGLSFGYIGNCGHNYDDRSFRYFTDLAWHDDIGCNRSSVSFGDYPTERLGLFAHMVANGALDRFAAEAAEKLASGKFVHRLGTAHLHAAPRALPLAA